MNVVGVSGVNIYEAHFKAMHNEGIYFLENQAGGFRLNYLKLGRNQGCNRDHDDSWRDCDML